MCGGGGGGGGEGECYLILDVSNQNGEINLDRSVLFQNFFSPSLFPSYFPLPVLKNENGYLVLGASRLVIGKL